MGSQGEITVTYALCPHKGRLSDSKIAELAYDLNLPMTAVRATGSEDRIPLQFSALTLDCDHVMCETVKEEEKGTGRILRLYEYKNVRDHVTLTVGLPAQKAYLCDLMEQELCELPICDGKIELDIKGFEILTVKLV